MEPTKLSNQHNKVVLHKVREEGMEAAPHVLALRTQGTSVAKGDVLVLLNEQRIGLCVPVEQGVQHHDFVHLKLSTGDVLEAYITGSASSDLEFVVEVDDWEPVLHNQAGEVIDGKTEVPDPAPQD